MSIFGLECNLEKLKIKRRCNVCFIISNFEVEISSAI